MIHCGRLATAGALILSSLSAAISSPSPTIAARAPSCTWSPSQITPTDIPTASPYVSNAGFNYFPMGSQNGNILDSSHTGYVFGPPTFPLSNSYALAVQECADFCDEFTTNGLGQCLSFNVFTVYESDFNNCIPTFECRFSDALYSEESYYTDNGTPSYAWTLDWIWTMPNCDPSAEYSPSLWTSSGMDAWLASTARIGGLWGQPSGFMGALMNDLNWPNYDCDSSQAADAGLCVENPTTTPDGCGYWIDRQAQLYFTYMDQIVNVLNTWQSLMIYENVVFDSFWNPSLPPASTFNWGDFLTTAVSSALGVVPGFGSILRGAFNVADAFVRDFPSSTGVVPVPNAYSSWSAFAHNYSSAMNTMAIDISSFTAAQGGNGSIIQMMANGTFFLDSADTITMDANLMWNNYKPYFDSTAAVAAMKAQGVFLMRAQWNIYSSASSCTQSIADQFARYINSDNTAGLAWCLDDGVHVMVPIAGWNMDVYRVMNSVTNAPIDITVKDVFTSADECFPNFNPSNPHISPYKTTDLSGFNFLEGSPDLTLNCTWPLPVLHYADWVDIAVGQSESQNDYSYGSTWDSAEFYNLGPGDAFPNMANWFAYQLGFRSSLAWCAETASDDCGADACVSVRYCANYQWPRVINPPKSHLGSGA